VRLVYICERKGLPSPDQQRETLRAAGLTDEELADAYCDRCTRKPEQPQRDYIAGAAREGDEVHVARPGVVATTQTDALRFLAGISEHGATLCVASTGRRYRVRPKAARDVHDGLSLAADIEQDSTNARMEKAREHKKGKTGGRVGPGDERIRAAKTLWFDYRISEREFVERTGIAGRTMRNHFGKRGTPAFGRALNKRRTEA